uniref:Alpha--sialyltransferase st3gal i-r2 n=1 Tax=Tetraselmis sp. GSL018 TaxID=582737 RepID=A0A061SD47_9CHLO
MLGSVPRLVICLLVCAKLSLTAPTRGLIRRRRWPGGNPNKGTGTAKPMRVQEMDPSKIQPSKHQPLAGKFNSSSIDRFLTPPRYCYYNISGGLTQPSSRRPVGGPSIGLAKSIAELLAEPRPCMYYTRSCNQNLSQNVDLKGNCCFGTRYLKNFKSDKDPRFVKRLPDLKPGSLGSCAAIGNADNVLRHKWGREIDSHDFVVRFNVKLKGFEEHVGTKTDGLWTKPNYEYRKEDGDQKPSRFHVNPKYAPADLEPIDGVPVLVYGPHLNLKWRPVAKEIYSRYVKEKRRSPDTKPTGGWARLVAMMELAATGACDRLDIYGFSSGGGKYFSRRYSVDSDHSISLEHFCHRLIMHTGIKGKVCVYGE